MVVAGRARRDDGHALRRRGAAAREQFHQVARAALQHPLPRRQELSVRLHHRRSVSAAALPSRQARPPHRYFGPFPERRRGARRHGARCRRCSSCARARTRCSPTARARACCTRSSAAPRRASGFISEAEYREDVEGAVLFLQRQGERGAAQLQAQMEGAAAARVRARGAHPRQDHAPADAAVAAVRRERDGRRHRRRRRGGGARARRRQCRDDPRRPPRRRPHVLSAPRRRRARSTRSCRRSSRSTTSSARCRRRSSSPDVEDHAALAEVLSAQAGHRVEIVGNPGRRAPRVARDGARRTPTFAIRQKLAQKATQEDRLAALQEALGLPPAAQRIECFDISHTMGEAAVASCVIFDRLAMQTSEYRRFNVTPAAGGDDYAAMREALTRRCARIVAGEYPAPDLLVVDGGKGQVGGRRRRARRAGAAPRGSSASRKARSARPGEEDIVFPDRDAVLNLPAGSSGAAPPAADPRRGAPVRDPGPPRASRRRRALRRRCRRSPASAPRSGRRCSRISAASRACRRRASTTSRACPA